MLCYAEQQGDPNACQLVEAEMKRSESQRNPH